MKRLYPFFWVLLLALAQSTILPAAFPGFPLTPVLVYLVFTSLRSDRWLFLAVALWAGFLQDLLLGENLGLFMLLSFSSGAFAWEIKNELIDNLALTGMVRVIAMSLLQDLFMAFILLIKGQPGLGSALQINAGINLLQNLLFYGLFLLIIKLFHPRTKLDLILEERP